ncbi:putative transmembrane protein 200A-like [Scophthalmus maximus]|uniref:Putative transmembrane protein 200A-like n=1 Tax=Scophthalmus maximus TaxID=52904 RepID=A0A2U9BLP6_SCOMX|nr:putative transmembrane protein 200A-like [Scophthalmus maximus]
MKTQKARGVKPNSTSGRRKSRFTLRGRKKKDGVIRGKLRIRSMPGAFLVLGMIVVVVGTALAVAGYWPYRISRLSILGAADRDSITESQTSGWSLGAKSFLSTASLSHNERMKLLGPVIMGVGLFILICANTVLYENRDRETQMLLAQMRSVICSVSAAVPSADLKEIAVANSMAKHTQWSSHSNSCNPSQTDLNAQYGVEHRDSTSFNVQVPPLIKFKNCLVSTSSMSTLEVDEVVIPAAQPRRCHSMSYRTNPHIPRQEGQITQLVATRRETGSQVCVNILEQVVDDVDEQTHQSWPRLDLGSGRRYLKLENKEDSVDKLLDQLEQQCSQWDKSFGSGPFQ